MCVAVIFFFCNASDKELTLTDKKNNKHTMSLDNQDFKLFPSLKNFFQYHQDKLEYPFQSVAYEAFVYVLKPLSNDIDFKEKKSHLTPEEIISSKELLEDTKNVIQWIEQQEANKNNEALDNLLLALSGADFLLAPFGIKRGIVNCLYDYNIANKLIEQSDLAENSSEWLISNYNFYHLSDPIMENYYSDQKGGYDVFNYADKQFRFFCFDEAIKDFKRFDKASRSYLWFDFKKNKIQHVNINQLNRINTLMQNEKKYRIIFDFRDNPLSEATKLEIKKLGSETKNEVCFDRALGISAYNKNIEDAEQEIKREEINLKLKNSITFKLFSILISCAAFFGTYAISSKIFLQSTYKSLTYGLSSLLFIFSLIFYLYKKEIDRFNSIAHEKIEKSKQSIEDCKKDIRELENSKPIEFEDNSRTFLIHEGCYIKYTV